MFSSRLTRFIPLAILLGSALLRFALAGQGGQYYFGDETRYDRGVRLFFALSAGDAGSIQAIAAQPDHSLFTWVGAALTPLHHGLAFLVGHGDWSQQENILGTMWIAAALLSLFSTLNLFLVHRLARAAGASDDEALWALALMAVANAGFYYSRHLLPYDCALSAALAALIVGVTRLTLSRAFLCGLLGGVCYGVYNGYWYLIPTLWLAHALACWREPPATRVRLSATCAAGLLVSLTAPLLLGTLLAGRAYWALLADFSGTVKQGLFAEGWSFPWEFLWHAEGPVSLALVFGFIASLWHARRTGEPLPARIRITLLALGAAYALLVLLSTGLSRFVLYGRTIKPFIPALCLLGAWAIHRLLLLRPRLRLAAVTLLLVAALTHFAPHFSQMFPREFKILTFATFGAPKLATTVSGIMLPIGHTPVTRPDLALVNALVLYPLRTPLEPPAGTTVLHAEHPLAYLPFQYEGYSPRERTLIRTHDLSMRVIKLAAPASVPDQPPAELTFGPQDFPSGRR